MDDSERDSNYNLMVENKTTTSEPNFFRRVKSTIWSSKKDSSVVKKGFYSLNELNLRFIKTNSYYVGLMIFLYIFVGVAIYHHWLGWNQFDSVYFIIITCITVGYGDYVPITADERTFTSFYIIFGIAMCGSLVGIISTLMSEHAERMAKQRNLRAFLHMKENKPTKGSTEEAPDSEINQSSELEEGTNSRPSSSDSFPRVARVRRSIYDFSYKFRKTLDVLPQEKTFEEISEDSIAAYREDLAKLKTQSARDFLTVFVIILIGMLLMMGIEGWTAANSFYWATCTITTVGYGDIVPDTRAGKIFTIIYVITGCAYMAKTMTDFVKYPLLSRLLKNEITVISQFSGDLSPEKLEGIFQNEFYKLIPDLKRAPNEMSKCEFVLMVLQLMNKVEEKDIYLVSKLFENLDKSRKGYLSSEEMVQQVTDAQARDVLHTQQQEQKEQEERQLGSRKASFKLSSALKILTTNPLSPSTSKHHPQQDSDGGANYSPFGGKNNKGKKSNTVNNPMLIPRYKGSSTGANNSGSGNNKESNKNSGESRPSIQLQDRNSGTQQQQQQQQYQPPATSTSSTTAPFTPQQATRSSSYTTPHPLNRGYSAPNTSLTPLTTTTTTATGSDFASGGVEGPTPATSAATDVSNVRSSFGRQRASTVAGKLFEPLVVDTADNESDSGGEDKPAVETVLSSTPVDGSRGTMDFI